jgi:hypothetical protein
VGSEEYEEYEVPESSDGSSGSEEYDKCKKTAGERGVLLKYRVSLG